MNQRSSAFTRIFAVIALVVALVAVIVVIGSAGGGGDSSGLGGHSGQASKKQAKPKHVPATYVVQSGDTLVSIAHRTGVPVVRIQALNPEVDPQILIAGEKLKLR